MRRNEGAPFYLALLAVPSIMLCGCGTTVPEIGEIWDDETGTTAVVLEKKIKEKIFCELNRAVAILNNDPKNFILASGPDPKNPGKTTTIQLKPLPETWGATLTLTLTVEEMSGLTPSLSLNTPLKPQDTHFSGGITVPGPQSFAFGLGGTLSSDATRFDKYTFFYKITDLETYRAECDLPQAPGTEAPRNFQGSSLLLESNLGIGRWLHKIADIRFSIGVSESKSSQQAFTYDTKFEVVSSGNITPIWKLTPVTTPTGSSPLFSVKRDRTHEMLLTLGPLAEPKPTPPGTAAAAQPGTLATNDALAAQIGAAVGAAVRSALGQ